MFKRNYLILAFIVLLALVLRFWQLDSNPPSLTWDEAAWGYNAYSLGIDGRDEFGKFLPIEYLESFGDFKPPLYAYLSVVPVWIFGLNEFSTRFISAFFGVLTVLVSYFLVKRIFPESDHKESYALLTALFLAISPWHIMLSRAAFEANVASFFIVSGVWLFLGGVQDRKWFLVPSAVCFALSFYTFNSARVVVPLLVAVLVFASLKKLRKNLLPVSLAFIIGLVMVLPLVPFLLSPQAGLRFKEVNIFTDPTIVETANRQIENDNNAIWSKVIHNRRIGYALSYADHYFDNFNPTFLFIKGDGNPKFSTQAVGQMYLWDLPFLILGAILLFRRREGFWWLVPTWILIGIIPAGMARETPHALRIETVLPLFQLLVAYGIVQLFFILKPVRSVNRYLIPFAGVLGALLFINLVYFLHGYYAHYARIYSGEWQYGYKQSIEYADLNKNKYDKIYVTEHLGRPYIYYLFYTKTDPAVFRSNSDVNRDAFGFVEVNRFSDYIFYEKPPKVTAGEKSLVISAYEDVPPGKEVLKTFNLLNGESELAAYEL